MGKTKKKTEKHLSAGKKLLTILLLSCSMVGLGVSIGFAAGKDIYALIFAALSAVVAFIMLSILLKDYQTKKKKTTKWYVDKYIAALVPVWVLSAIFLIAVGYDENETIMYIGFLMFPAISMMIAPNAALYALRDSKGWKKIFYANGNLERFKDTNVFYSIKPPVDFERKIYRAVIKDQFLDVFALISLMFIIALVGIWAILTYDSHSVAPGDLLYAIRYVKLRRGTGLMAFLLLLVVVFGFPAFVYYVTNAIYKLRIIAKHQYMAYHAIVRKVDSYRMLIDCDGRCYEYKYSTLVGMKENQINNTPAVLIFIPDSVVIFPDEILKA